MRFGHPLLSKFKTCSALAAAGPAGGNTPVTGHPGSTLPTLPRKELRKYYELGRALALPGPCLPRPNAGRDGCKDMVGEVMEDRRQIFERSLFSPQSAQRPRREMRRIVQVSVSFCGFPCHSALEAGLDFQVFAQLQAGLARFQGGFFRELCPSASSIPTLRQSRVPARLPERQGRCGG